MRKSIIVCILIFLGVQYSYAQKMTIRNSSNYILMEVNDEGTKGSITIPDTSTSISVETNKLYNLNGTLIWNGTALGTAGSAGGWTDGGSNVYLTTLTDKVGIGTTGPLQALDIRGNLAFGMDADREIAIHGWDGKLTIKAPDEVILGTYESVDEGFPGSVWKDRLICANSGNVGIGDTSPTHKLDVAGKIGVNDIQVLYLPDQTDFTGTFIIGTGGGSLSHASGYEGRYNTGIGQGALNAITTGAWNTATGHWALYTNTTGDKNTASGDGALYTNSTGSGNTATGDLALYTNSTGENNTANGSEALFLNTEGFGNTANGSGALYANTTGFGNTASGELALYTSTTGYNNTALGYSADVSTSALNNATAIGAKALVDASNKVRIGDSLVTVIEGQVAWTFSSDKNLKENFLDVDGEYILNELREFNLHSWNYKHDSEERRHYGPMGQEFFSSFGHDELGTIGTQTTLCGSDVAGINMIAIQALEKRTAEIKDLKKQNEQQGELIESLIARIEQLENK
jgi:hypothetical protein